MRKWMVLKYGKDFKDELLLCMDIVENIEWYTKNIRICCTLKIDKIKSTIDKLLSDIERK